MGVVYAAEQLHPIRRQVAVKVVRAGFGSADIITRFEAERQALAVMEHPGIARVFDAGTTEDGRPYFAMEHVEGVPFTTWCDDHKLTTRERVRLFLPLCHAIQHAHQKGIIHRDLKPSNVLVTEQAGEPLPKVIDFGIAKAVNRRLTDQTLVTEIELAMGTPAYMSPEQAEGAHLDVDTRTDIYALGVMLYVVLAGSLPLDPAKMGLVPFIAQLMARLTMPPTPSTRLRESGDTLARLAESHGTEPATLVREIRGDLDAITLKAIAPERERRYQTATELAQDLERFLDDEPVLARAPSVRYRASKFVRRHPTGVALAASAAIFLVGLTTVTMVQAGRIARARTIAEQRRTQAEDLLGFMVGDLRGKLEPIGRLALLDDVGKRAMAYFASVPAGELSDEELYRRSQALSQLGQLRLAQGDLDQALAAFRESLAQAKDLAARDSMQADWMTGLGAGHFYVGYVHYLRGQHDSALAQFEPYLDVSRRLVARDPTKPEYQLEEGYAHSNIGSVREAQGDWARAIDAFRYTLAVKQRLVALDSSNMDWRVDLGVSHNAIGRAHERAGQLDSAEAHYLADLAVREGVARRDTSNAVWQERLGPALTYLAAVDEMRGRIPAARARFDSALRVSRALTARDPSNANWAREAAASLQMAGRVRMASGERAAGLELARESRSILRRISARDSSNADMRTQLGVTEIEIARALAGGGDVAGARQSLDSAEAHLAPLAAAGGAEGRARMELARARVVLADLLEAQGAVEASRAARRRALEALGADGTKDELRAVEVRARALAGLGRTDESERLLRRLRDAGVRTSFITSFTAAATPRQ